MSIRREMLQVARLAPKLLGDSTALVETFVRSQALSSGGFADRTGSADLYYTVFGLESLVALQAELPTATIRPWLEHFDAGDSLDLVHLCCLIRCWTLTEPNGAPRDRLTANLGRYRSADGGFHPRAGNPHGTAYAAFLATAAWQDLGSPIPAPLQLARSFKFLETPDSAWANERGIAVGATNATAAACAVLRHLDMPIADSVADWLLARHHPQGGFVAVPGAPLPDLLSTATALHSLAAAQRDLSAVREPCLDFIDTLWSAQGGFHGHWADDHLDVEYTYYGLLALGHLSLV